MTDIPEEVSRVAKAIYEHRECLQIAFGAMPSWEEADEYDRNATVDLARVAVEAMQAALLSERRKQIERDAKIAERWEALGRVNDLISHAIRAQEPK